MSGALAVVGATSPRASIPFTTPNAAQAASITLAQFTLNTNGNIDATNGTTSVTTVGQWLKPAAGTSRYWAQSSNVVGTAFTADPSAGAWVQLSSSRTWTLQSPAAATRSNTFTLKIAADAAGTIVLATASMSMSADGT